MSPPVLIAAYSVLIVAASLFGGWLPAVLRLTHTRMQLMMSFVAGLMLGVALLHLLPHSIAELGSVDRAVWWMLVGLLVMFFLVRALHFHQHGVAEASDAGHEPHEHHHGQDATHQQHSTTGRHRWSWLGVAIGLALHSTIDGVALAASVVSEGVHDDGAVWLGLGTFFAVLLHKPLDALSITSLMAAGAWSPRVVHLVNLGFSLMCPVGAVLFYLGSQSTGSSGHVLVGLALAFSAGVFICISLGDLLPELQFHTHDRVKLSMALLVGVAMSYLIGAAESEHAHPTEVPAHDHHHHD